MRKLLCLMLGVSLIGAMIVVAGCGGGGGIGAIIGVGILVIALSASGPAGAAAFAANVRAAPANSTLSASYTAIVTPTGRTPISTDSVYVDNVTKKILSFDNLSVEASTDGQYKVEIYPRNYTANTSPIFKYYFTHTVPAGETETTTESIDASDTARALIYDTWAGKATMNIDQFSNQLPQASLDAVVGQISNDMGNLAAGRYTANFNWSGNTTTAIQTAANDTPTTPTYNSGNVLGWWLLTPSTSSEYAAILATDTHLLGRSSMFGFTGGSFNLQPNGTLKMWLDNTNPLESVDVNATMTSMTTMTYAAYDRHTSAAEEAGSVTKVSNPAACAGTWKGTAQNGTANDQITVVIDSNGLITAFYGLEQDSLPPFNARSGFVVSEGGKVAGYAKFADADVTQVRFFGTLSGTTFNGTLESTSNNPHDLPSGAITMTKQAQP